MSNESLNLLLALLPELALIVGGSLCVMLLVRRAGLPDRQRGAAQLALVAVWAAIMLLQFGPRIAQDDLLKFRPAPAPAAAATTEEGWAPAGSVAPGGEWPAPPTTMSVGPWMQKPIPDPQRSQPRSQPEESVGADLRRLAQATQPGQTPPPGMMFPREPLPVAEGPAAIRLDPLARAGRWAALMLGILLVGGAWSLPEQRRGPAGQDRGSPEFFMLLLFSLAGLMLTAMANDIIVLFLSLELTSVPTFIAVALSRRQREAAEGAGKYFFLGAFSVAIFIMGLIYLFGLTGQTNLELLVRSPGGALGAVAVVGVALTLAGLGFKIASVPYHVYLADVYQGAAAPISGWLSFVPKAAGILAMARILVAVGGMDTAGGWIQSPALRWTVWGLAVATMSVGNVLALWQKNVKRLLAYSSVAHSGYLLVALLVAPSVFSPRASADSPAWIASSVLMFYLVAYGIANLGAFLVLAGVRRASADGGDREAETLADLHGLSRRKPAMAIAMAIFGFSLMGLPPTIGFMAKVYVFVGAYNTGFNWLVVIALVNAAVGVAYYLRMVAACWLSDDNEPSEAETDSPHRAPGLVVGVLAVATVAFGLLPSPIYNRLTQDIRIELTPRGSVAPTPEAEAR